MSKRIISSENSIKNPLIAEKSSLIEYDEEIVSVLEKNLNLIDKNFQISKFPNSKFNNSEEYLSFIEKITLN